MIDIDQRDGVILITVTIPRIDVSTAVRFHEASCKAIDGSKKVVFDLTRVEFMDSTGIGALVGVAKRIGRDGRAAVTGLNPTVKTIFSLLRMDMVFSVQPSTDSAVQYLTQ
jgi:anti-anti-sigma factor